MRIVVLNDYGFVNGGATQVAISSLHSLADLGHDVTYIYGAGPLDPKVDASRIKTISLDLYDLLGNPSRVDAFRKGLWNPESAQRLLSILSSYPTSDTVIHLHGWMHSLSSSVIQAIQTSGFRSVCTLHDYFAACPNGGFYNFQHREHCQLQPLSSACILTNCDARSYPQKLWRVARQQVQLHLAHMPSPAMSYITVSRYSEDILRPYLPPQSQIFRISNPIDIGQSYPAAVSQHSAFTFAGRLAAEKGADLFARASAKVGVTARFMGKGAQMKTIRSINPTAELPGWRDSIGVQEAIRQSRALVFPSRWHETQGLAVLEAAALGVPAIVADNCAANELIQNNVTGISFRSGDVDDLASKLLLLHHNPALAEAMGRQAYQRYWEHPPTPANHARQLVACYEAVLRAPASLRLANTIASTSNDR